MKRMKVLFGQRRIMVLATLAILVRHRGRSRRIER